MARLRHGFSALFAIFVITGALFGVQSIDYLKADPSDVAAGSTTTVTFTTQIGLDATLIKNSVKLVEYNASGKIIATLPMYDDGTHGDLLPGDNIFTTQVVMTKPAAATYSFKVTVAYQGVLTRLQSTPITLNVVKIPTQAQMNQVLALNIVINTRATALIQQYGVDAARPMIVGFVASQAGISTAGIGQDGQTIWFQYKVGGYGYLNAGPPNTLSVPSGDRALVFSPVSTLGTVNNELVAVYNKLLSPNCCIQPDPVVRDSAVTVDFLKTIYPYGVISIVTHGGIDGAGNVVLQTGEIATTIGGIPTTYLIDWILGRLEINALNYWSVTQKFFSHYGGSFPGSLVLISACHSLENTALSNALIGKGAKTVFGWSESVSVDFAGTVKEDLLAQMVDLKQDSGTAYNNVPHIDTSVTPNAVLEMAGATDLQLPNSVVSNGSFETGDFGGWINGADYAPVGYSAVVTGNSSEGTFSARLGRFDEIYAGGINGPPDGNEPLGTDYMYQDVQLPPSGPVSLTFSYNIQSYDSYLYDWLDVFVEDPSTGQVLSTVVSQAGNPSTSWGTYWNGGWQIVNSDLTAFAGQKVRIWFGVRQDGYGDQTAAWIDNVSINCH